MLNQILLYRFGILDTPILQGLKILVPVIVEM